MAPGNMSLRRGLTNHVCMSSVPIRQVHGPNETPEQGGSSKAIQAAEKHDINSGEVKDSGNNPDRVGPSGQYTTLNADDVAKIVEKVSHPSAGS